MAYTYFCTECGQENGADSVLFDMDTLLTQSGKQKLNIIRLRMNQAQLEALIDSGEAAEDGYSSCSLRFEQLADYLAEPQSMNDERLRELRLSDIEDYLFPNDSRTGSSAGTAMAAVDADDILGDDFLEEELDDIFGETAPKPEAKKKEIDYSKLPESIQALLFASTANTGLEEDEILLKSDLQTLYRLFETEEDLAYHFTIKRHLARDDKKEQYIDGYWLNGTAVDNVRICHRCRKMLFAKAGAAEHRVVSFIGETAAGKTSTILSLTHYALHGLNGIGEGNAEIMWKNNPNIPEQKLYDTVIPEALRGLPNELESDLNWFTFGVAPKKTEAGKREDAYHSTLLMQNKEGKRMIISLMDLPGELFNNGKVDEDKVMSAFTAALSSSAFIICFDARTVTIEDITNLTNFSNQMQDLRLSHMKGEKHYVPSMILFTMADGVGMKALPPSVDTTELLREMEEAEKGIAITEEQPSETGKKPDSTNPSGNVENTIIAECTDNAGNIGNTNTADNTDNSGNTGNTNTADNTDNTENMQTVSETEPEAGNAVNSTPAENGPATANAAAPKKSIWLDGGVDAENEGYDPEAAATEAILLQMERESFKPSDLYMLREERDAMADESCDIHRIYRVVRTVYDKNPMLRDSYYAVMRCGAFGHMVPTTRDISARGPALNEDNHITDVDEYNRLVEEFNQNAYTDEELAEANKRVADDDEYDKLILVYDYNVRTTEYNRQVDEYNSTVTHNNEKQIKRIKACAPMPNQMDVLMQWILRVTGCLPCDAIYETKAATRSLEHYYIGNLEYRAANPGKGSVAEDADLDEAMARQMLFINPGQWDDALLKALNNQKESTGLIRLVERMFDSRIEGSLANVRSRMNRAPESNSQDPE